MLLYVKILRNYFELFFCNLFEKSQVTNSVSAKSLQIAFIEIILFYLCENSVRWVSKLSLITFYLGYQKVNVALKVCNPRVLILNFCVLLLFLMCEVI